MNLKELFQSLKCSSQDLENIRETAFEAVYASVQYSRKELEKQLDVDGFTANIMALPEKIRVQQEVYKEARTAFETAKSNLVNAESMLMTVITAETNDNGKPKFSNDTLRRAELELRKNSDRDYNEAWELYKAALGEMENEQFRLEQLQNEFKAYQTVGNLLSARLSLMRLEL